MFLNILRACVWMGLLALGAVPLCSTADEAASAPAASSLFLAQAQGPVTLLRNDQPVSLDPPQWLQTNDRLVTGDDGTADLEFQNGGVVEEGPDSDSTIQELKVTQDTFRARFLLALGRLKAQVKKLTSSSSCFEIKAGGVVAGVRGTVFGVSYDRDQEQVSAQTYEGSIFARHDGKEDVVQKGFGMVLANGSSPITKALSVHDMASFKDFLSTSTDLQQKKQQLLQQIHDSLPDPVKKGVDILNSTGVLPSNPLGF